MEIICVRELCKYNNDETCNYECLIEEPYKRLISAYEDYIKILDDELNEIVGIASVYGWRSNRFEAGKQARDKIIQLKSML